MRKSLPPLICLLTLFLAACTLPGRTPAVTRLPTVATTPAKAASPTPGGTWPSTMPARQTSVATLDYTQCGWTWATQSLPEISAEVQAALVSAGLTQASGIAQAYGENCLQPSGEVDHFAALETDFRISLPVPDLEDRQALGALLERILLVLQAFPPEATPGPAAGYVAVRFIGNAQEMNLWFSVTEAEAALGRGLRGVELLDALANK